MRLIGLGVALSVMVSMAGCAIGPDPGAADYLLVSNGSGASTTINVTLERLDGSILFSEGFRLGPRDHVTRTLPAGDTDFTIHAQAGGLEARDGGALLAGAQVVEVHVRNASITVEFSHAD